MARARNIKPGFFSNDVLAEHNDPLGRLLFIGLWTLADCNGNLEWRSKRIKAQLLPYDDCDIKQLGINLDKSGFVRFYSDGDKILLHIPKFVEHQNPHKNERDKGPAVTPYSEDLRQLIDLTTLTINPDLSGADPESDGTDPADSLLLNPDSPSLNPEGGIPNDDGPPPGKPDGESAAKQAVAYLNAKAGSKFQNTKTNLGHVNARLSEGNSLDDVKAVIDFKAQEWGPDPKMRQYLRPETLFSQSKFPGYLAAARASPQQSRHSGFDQREYTEHTPDWAKEA